MSSNSINQGAAGGIIIQPTWGTIEGGGSSGKEDNFDAILNELRTYLDAKADKKDVYTKDDVYTKTETDDLLDEKSNTGHTHDDRYYTETETDGLLDNKFDISTWKTSGTLNINVPGTVDVTKADNNVSTSRYFYLNVNDSQGRQITRHETQADPAGTVSSIWYVRNYDTSGSMTGSKGIQMIMDKAGTLTYRVHDASNFRSAISAAASDHTHSYLPLSGGTLSGDLLFSTNGDTGTRQIRLVGGSNDYGRLAVGATANNAGWMEIATADDGTEPIYVRQYTGVYSTVTRTLTLLDANGNTSIPRTVIAMGNMAMRPTDANRAATGSGGLYMFKATASMSSNKPPADAHVLGFEWDNTGGWDNQLALSTGGGAMYFRGMNNGTWQSWNTVLHSGNYSSYALPYSGGTLTGALNFANNTWNKMGDDCYIGDCNAGGCIGIKGMNGTTGIRFVQYNATAAGTIAWNGTKFTVSAPIIGFTTGSSWYLARDYCVIKQDHTVDGSYAAVFSCKTVNGDWSLGTVPNSDRLCFSYVTNTNYNNKANQSYRFNLSAPPSGNGDMWIMAAYSGTGGMTDGSTALATNCIYYQY